MSAGVLTMSSRKEQLLTNMPYDEALELSQSQDSEMSMDDRKAAAAAAAEEKRASRGRSGPSSSLDGAVRGESKFANEPFDEAHELDESEDSLDTADGLGGGGDAKTSTAEEEKRRPMDQTRKPAQQQAVPASSNQATTGVPPKAQQQPSAAAREKNEDSEESDEESAVGPRKVEGQYDPNDYKDLDVSSEVKDLFHYITRYTPHEIELDSTLKCFVPDYIPAVGEMDPFIKVPRPDGQRDNLGLSVLDEPAAAQSDATVLELQLRAVSKKHHGDVAVRSIENAAKSPLEIERWIRSIADLHRTKPQTQINYRKPMPDLDNLMAEWPAALEDKLKELELPVADLDVSLPDFVRIVCAILDIPVYDNLVESLHHLFLLYLEFTENAHFASAAAAH